MNHNTSWFFMLLISLLLIIGGGIIAFMLATHLIVTVILTWDQTHQQIAGLVISMLSCFVGTYILCWMSKKGYLEQFT